jgi:putative flippase GtrA
MSFFYFLCSGAFSTLLDVGLFRLLGIFLDGSLAFVLSYAFCVFVRYFIDARLVLDIERRASSFLSYAGVNLLVMCIGLLAYRQALVAFTPLQAKIISIPVTLVSGFVILKGVVFRKSVSE